MSARRRFESRLGNMEHKTHCATPDFCAHCAADEYVSETGWQPMETAPKDGTVVLLYVPPNNKEMLVSFMAEGFCMGGRWCFPFPDSLRPTHWMPLPEPPK